jgi:signal-transduction protein with cAMP-binding, CBS, and nucleotidyltransferase domain
MARPPRARPAHARRDADIELLHQVALRRPLPQSTIEDLAASPERVVFAPGATVFEEGEAGESFYIVAAVHAEVTRRGAHFDQLGPGSYFGETELLRSDLPRTATVRAADDTILHVGVLARERLIAAVTAFASSAKRARSHSWSARSSSAAAASSRPSRASASSSRQSSANGRAPKVAPLAFRVCAVRRAASASPRSTAP